MEFIMNCKTEEDKGFGMATGICPIQNIIATNGIGLEYTIECIDNVSRLNQVRVECPPIDPMVFPSPVDNCETVQNFIVAQASSFPFSTSNRCNVQCKPIAPVINGSNTTRDTGFPLIIGALLFLLFMSFKK